MVVTTGIAALLVTALAVLLLILQLEDVDSLEGMLLYFPSAFLAGCAWIKLGKVALQSVAAKVPSERIVYELRVLLGIRLLCCGLFAAPMLRLIHHLHQQWQKAQAVHIDTVQPVCTSESEFTGFDSELEARSLSHP